jgi:hypothetical protein
VHIPTGIFTAAVETWLHEDTELGMAGLMKKGGIE